MPEGLEKIINRLHTPGTDLNIDQFLVAFRDAAGVEMVKDFGPNFGPADNTPYYDFLTETEKEDLKKMMSSMSEQIDDTTGSI